MDYLSDKISVDDIVFEGRNKSYGAYQMRKVYNDYIIRSFGIASVIMALFLLGPVIAEALKPEDELVEEEIITPIELKKLEEPPPIDPKTPPPPPMPAAPPPPAVTQIRFIPPEIAPDEKVVEDPPKQEQLKEAVASDKTQEGDPNADPNQLVIEGEIGGTGTGVVAEPEPEEIFTIVEQQPTFPGGEAEMIKYIQKNTKYPYAAQKAEVQGTVYLQFVVNPDGRLSDFQVVRGQGFGLDEEALRVAKTMPNWAPGKMGGRAVKVRVSIPVKFKLS